MADTQYRCRYCYWLRVISFHMFLCVSFFRNLSPVYLASQQNGNWFTMKALNQICNLAALHFSCLICRISSDGGGFRGRWWHDSRNEQDASRPYTVLSIVLARAASSWEVRDADARDAWQGWMRIHRVGVTRDKPNCGRSRCKSVNELQVWPFSRYLLGTVLQPQSKSK